MDTPADIDVVAYLASKGLHGKGFPGGEMSYPCFLDCGEDPRSGRRKLYVNTTTGMYECKVCLAHGGTTLLQQHFGDTPERSGRPGARAPRPRPAPASRLDILERAADLAHAMACQSEEALAYLNGDRRGLDAATIRSRRLGFVPPNWSLVGQLDCTIAAAEDAGLATKDGRDFFRDRILIPYIQDGRVVQLRGKDINGRYYTSPGDRVRLYGADDVAGADDVIVVEGEFDAMTLAALLAESPDPRISATRVCGVPGANAWPEDADRILRDARRVFIGTDPDDTGRKAADRLAERIGARARILPWPEHLLARPAADGLQPKDIDWTALKVGYGLAWQDVAALMHESAGRRLLSMAEAGARLRTRPKDGGIRIGFSDIDSWLAPGLLPGQLMIPLAKTGTGKTVFLCNVAHANRHRHVLFITLEMTAEEVYDRMTRIHRFAAPHATTDDVETALARILICDENRLGERDLAELVDEYEYQTGARPDLLLLDYLGYYARGAQGGSPYEKTSNAVMQLKAEAKRHRLAVIAPHQVNRGATDGRPIDSSDARDSGVVEETADFLLAIYRPDEALTVNGQPTGRLKLSILKSRHGNRDRVASVQMGVLSLAMVDATSPLAKAAQDEAYLVSQGTTYDTYLRNRTAPVQKELL